VHNNKRNAKDKSASSSNSLFSSSTLAAEEWNDSCKTDVTAGISLGDDDNDDDASDRSTHFVVERAGDEDPWPLTVWIVSPKCPTPRLELDIDAMRSVESRLKRRKVEPRRQRRASMPSLGVGPQTPRAAADDKASVVGRPVSTRRGAETGTVAADNSKRPSHCRRSPKQVRRHERGCRPRRSSLPGNGPPATSCITRTAISSSKSTGQKKQQLDSDDAVPAVHNNVSSPTNIMRPRRRRPVNEKRRASVPNTPSPPPLNKIRA